MRGVILCLMLAACATSSGERGALGLRTPHLLTQADLSGAPQREDPGAGLAAEAAALRGWASGLAR